MGIRKWYREKIGIGIGLLLLSWEWVRMEMEMTSLREWEGMGIGNGKCHSRRPLLNSHPTPLPSDIWECVPMAIVDVVAPDSEDHKLIISVINKKSQLFVI